MFGPDQSDVHPLYWLDCPEAPALGWLTLLANQSVDTHQVLQQVLVQLDSQTQIVPREGLQLQSARLMLGEVGDHGGDLRQSDTQR